MMKLKKPNFSLKDVYPSCISHYKDPNKEKLMKSIASKLLEDEKRYLERMKNQELYLEPKNQTHNDKITPQDLIDLYKHKLLKKKYDVREYYDIIRLSSKICPFFILFSKFSDDSHQRGPSPFPQVFRKFSCFHNKRGRVHCASRLYSVLLLFCC